MQELYIDEHTCRDEFGIPHIFQYFLLTQEAMYDRLPCTEYGVMIRSSSREQVCIPHITTDYARISGLLSLLTTNGVSPSHLADIVADWL